VYVKISFNIKTRRVCMTY